MQPILKAFFDLCRFRLGPQDLPASIILLYFSILLSLVTSLAALSISGVPVASYMLGDLLDLLLAGTLLYFALRLTGGGPRFVQSFTALAGCDALLQLLSLPALLLLSTAEPGQSLHDLGVLLLIGLLGWSLAVAAHILRHAFEVRFGFGLLIAILYFILISGLTAKLLGGP